MAKVKYVGDPRNKGEGPNETTARGYAFVKGKETEIPDSDVEGLRRFSTNGHFEVTQGAADPDPVRRGPGRPPKPRDENDMPGPTGYQGSTGSTV